MSVYTSKRTVDKQRAAAPPFLIQFALILVNVHFAVVIAVVATRAVQVTTDQIVSVIAVRERRRVRNLPSRLCPLSCDEQSWDGVQDRGISSAHVYRVVINVVAVHVVHMTIMEVAVVIVVFDSLVTTAVAVLMIVLSVNFTRHLNSPLSKT